jgi:predicted small metal-binding protein
MAKKFACGDVMSGCGWSATAQDESELFKKIAEHAKNAHNITSIPDEVIQKVKSKIQDA